MRVHRSRPVFVLIAQSHVGNGLPVARKGLNITIVQAVEGVAFDAVAKVFCLLQGPFIARGSCIFAQSVDGKTEGVGLLFGVERTPLGIQTPKNATLLRVDKVGHEIFFGPGCSLQVFGFTQNTIGSGKGPQYARIENRSFFGIGHRVAVAVYAPQKAATAMVYHLIKPKRQDVLGEFGLQFVFQSLQRHFLFSSSSAIISFIFVSERG